MDPIINTYYNMGKLIDQFIEKPAFDYGCGNYIPGYNIDVNYLQVDTTNNGRGNNGGNNGRGNNGGYVNNNPQRRLLQPDAFMGYDGHGAMYGLHLWNGNG